MSTALAEDGHEQQHERVEDGGEQRATALDAPEEHDEHDAGGEDAGVDDGEQPDVPAEAPLRDVPVEAEREGGGLQRRAGVGEGVLFAELGLDDEPQRVEEAAADAQQRAHGVVVVAGLVLVLAGAATRSRRIMRLCQGVMSTPL